MERPKPLEDTDLSSLYDLCEEYLDFVIDPKEYFEDNDYPKYFMQFVMIALYGDNIWDFINESIENIQNNSNEI